jgi:hypothetical protein
MSNIVRLDGILWEVSGYSNHIIPLCPKHRIELEEVDPFGHIASSTYRGSCRVLSCQACEETYTIPRQFNREVRYVSETVEAKKRKQIKALNLDEEAVPLASDKASNDDYFVKALLTKSNTGLRLVVYAGEKGQADKTQIFVEPEIKRLSFDQNNLNPSEVFLKFEAEFADGIKHTVERKNTEKKVAPGKKKAAI